MLRAITIEGKQRKAELSKRKGSDFIFFFWYKRPQTSLLMPENKM